MLRKFSLRIKTFFVGLFTEPAFYVYLVAAVIYLPWFLPHLKDIGPWDETYYLISGKALLSGDPPTLAYGPLLSLFYALCYLPFRNSPFWLVQANSLGRFLLFTGLFVGTWQVGKALKKYFNPLVLLGFLFLTPLLVDNFDYPADPLFAALSALAFASAIRFLRKKSLKYVWWSSFWLGLGMLTRGDALMIFLGVLVFFMVVGWRSQRWWRILLAILIPFVVLSGGYVVLRGVITGDFDTGMAHRAYTAFEQGQEVDMPEGEQRFHVSTASYYVARDLFGTPEENDYSVFRAISRNPEAYFSRLLAVVKLLPGLFLTAYYRRFTVLIALLALRGLIELFVRKKYKLAILHLIWILPISAGIARTLVRVGYYRLFFFVFFSLAIIGLNAFLDRLRKGWEGLALAGIMLAVLIYALSINDRALQFGMTIFLCWLLLSYLLARRSEQLPRWQWMSMLLLLAAGLVLRGDFRIYTPRILGQDYREAASLALREVTDPGDLVLTNTASVVFMADRQVANFSGSDIPEFESSDAFIEWMALQDFVAIYLDPGAPDLLWELAMDQTGEALELVYADESAPAYILLLEP
jgi:hypothetical protein